MPNDIQIKNTKPNFSEMLNEVPHQPGIYIMRDRLGKVIYVGKAIDLRKRLSNYFTPSRSTTSDPKTRSLIASIWDFDIHIVKNNSEALLLESKMIKEYRPRYNVLMRDDKRYLMAKINLQEPFPLIHFTRIKKNDGAIYFGPYANSTALKDSVRWINKFLGLRNCKPLIPNEQDYKHCHDDIIKNCSAPCIKKISQAEYKKLAKRAVGILNSSNAEAKEIIAIIEEQMVQAANKKNFESAAKLRDTISSLKYLIKPVKKFAYNTTINNNNEQTQSALIEIRDSLHLKHTPDIMECFDISNISDTHIVASMVQFKNGSPANSNYRRYRIKTTKGQNDFASMSEVVRRRYYRILQELKKKFPELTLETQENPSELFTKITEKIKKTETDTQDSSNDFFTKIAEKNKKVNSKQTNKKSQLRLPDLIIVDGGKGQLSSATKELQKLGLYDVAIIGLAKGNEEIFLPNESKSLKLPLNSPGLKMLRHIRDEAHRFANTYHQALMKKRISESILDDCPGISKKSKEILLKEFGSVARLRNVSKEKIAELPGISLKKAETILNYLAINTKK